MRGTEREIERVAERDRKTGLDTKDCPLAQDNQSLLLGKQIVMLTCPTDNQVFNFFVDILSDK